MAFIGYQVPRPSSNAAASFQPSALGKPRVTKTCLRRTRIRAFGATRIWANFWFQRQKLSRGRFDIIIIIRVPRMRHSCRGHLTQAEGRDGAETTGEGRQIRAISVKSRKPATFKPRRRRAGSSGGNSPAPKASGCLSAKREPRRGRKGPSRASDEPRVRGSRR